MDSKLTLLKEFYRSLPNDRAKVETASHGFPYLAELLSDGASLEYGEAHPSGSLYKYKLAHISAHRMDELLRSHVEKSSNVCLYFADLANAMFCFNLDNNHKSDNEAIIPEMAAALDLLRGQLSSIGIEPLVIPSGRGCHLWCRLDAPLENGQLYRFMLRSMVLTFAELHKKGFDHAKIKANFYPDIRIRNTVSLRLFGSDHARTKRFSRILTESGLLDEEASWAAFEYYLKNKTLSAEQFHRAYSQMPDSDFVQPFAPGDADRNHPV